LQLRIRRVAPGDRTGPDLRPVRLQVSPDSPSIMIPDRSRYPSSRSRACSLRGRRRRRRRGDSDSSPRSNGDVRALQRNQRSRDDGSTPPPPSCVRRRTSTGRLPLSRILRARRRGLRRPLRARKRQPHRHGPLLLREIEHAKRRTQELLLDRAHFRQPVHPRVTAVNIIFTAL